ncbi:PepSY domain-containing protein [Paenibacillus sp. NPDC058071]|uniref:PepSY domain-containing protein n=1 Tax=Paenibacillus sp. NPDC058071 TaxID=3346326 RepID=UPI0036D8620E
MNKKIMIGTIAVIAALGGTGAAVAAESHASYIGKEKAKAAALQAVPSKVTEIELDNERNVAIYEIDVQKNDAKRTEFEIKINAATGSVLSVKEDDDDDRKPVTAKGSTTTASKSSESKEAVNAGLTAEQAKKLALKQVQGEAVKTEVEWDDGIKEYEVTVRTGKGMVEVTIAAADGRLISIDYDEDDDDEDEDEDDNREDDRENE